MKKIFLSMLLILSLLSLSACSSSNELLGYWLSTDGMTLNFTGSNTVSVGHYGNEESELYHYQINGNTVNLTPTDSSKDTSVTLVYDFTIDEDDKILTLSDNNHSYSYYGSDYMIEEIVIGLTINNNS